MDLKTFRRKVQYESALYLKESTSGEDPKESILDKVDLEAFLEKRSNLDREIFTMFLSSYTIRTIAKTLSLPYSSCKYHLYRMIQEYRNKVLGRKDKE